MTDELSILGSLDQPLVVDNEWILQRAEEIVQEALTKHNVEIALNACEQLIKVSKLSGVGLAKLYYLLKERWDEFGTNTKFDEVAFERLGNHKHTIERYVKVYEHLFISNEVPEEYREHIQQHSIKSQIPIANALAQGEEINDDAWSKLSIAPDYNTVLKIVREDIKGLPPRKGSLQLWMDDLGSIWAFFDGERLFVGSLEIDSDDEAVQKAIERIKKGCGILES